MGQTVEALAADRRAVDLYEKLACEDPATHEPDLTRSLNSLVVLLSEGEQGAEALVAARRAVAIWEKLAMENPAAYEAELGISLNGLALFLREVGFCWGFFCCGFGRPAKRFEEMGVFSNKNRLLL